MSINATLQLALSVLESLTVGVPDVSSGASPIRHDQFNVGPKTLNASTTPPAAQVSSQQLTGTQTIDLTALPGAGGAVINGTGQKVQAVLITCLSANAGAMTVAPGASNGYQLLGANAITIPLGGTIALDAAGNTPAIDATHKTLTCTPANPADKFNVIVVLG
jgi:hypothetical protein